MIENDGTVQIRIRIPQELKGRIEESAKGTLRSLNAEYTARLDASFHQTDQRQRIAELVAEVERLTKDLDEETEERRKAEEARRRDTAAHTNELGKINRSWNDTGETLNSLIEAIDRRDNNEAEVTNVLRYLSGDTRYIDAEVAGRPKVVLAPPPPPVKSLLAENLRAIIDQRTASIVRLALKLAGVGDNTSIERQIAADHSINRGDDLESGQ